MNLKNIFNISTLILLSFVIFICLNCGGKGKHTPDVTDEKTPPDVSSYNPPPVMMTPQDYFDKAQQDYRDGDLESAITNLNLSIKNGARGSLLTEVRYTLGKIYREQKRTDDAIKEFRTVIEMDRGELALSSFEMLAAIYIEQGRTTEAHKVLLERDRFLTGIRSAEDAKHTEPDAIIAGKERIINGNTFYEEGELDKAIEEYKMAKRVKNLVNKYPSYKKQIAEIMVTACEKLSEIYAKKNMPKTSKEEKAEADTWRKEMEKPVSVSPEYPDKPVTILPQSSEKNPIYAEAWKHYDTAKLYQQEGNYDSAIDEYKQAVALVPEWAEAHSNLSTVYMKKGDKNSAITHSSTANKLWTEKKAVIPPRVAGETKMITDEQLTATGSDTTLYVKGRLYYQAKRYNEAQYMFRTLFDKFPKSAYTDDALFSIAECYYESKRYDLALDAYKEVVNNTNRDNKDDDAQLMIGKCYYKLGRKQEAKSAFEVLLKDPKYSKSPYLDNARKWIKKCQ